MGLGGRSAGKVLAGFGSLELSKKPGMAACVSKSRAREAETDRFWGTLAN